MGKIKTTQCQICLKKFKGKLGLNAHCRLKHPYGIELLKESQEYSDLFMENNFMKEHEKSIIEYKYRMSTLASLLTENPILIAILVEWEKAQLRQIACNHPIFKNWTFRYTSPFSKAIEVMYEAIGFMACEYYECWLKDNEMKSDTDIDEILNRIFCHSEEQNFFDYYYERKFWMWHSTYQTLDDKMHKFLKCIFKSSHVKVLAAVKIIEGDGVWMLGNPIRYGPKNILPHMNKYSQLSNKSQRFDL